MPACVCEELRGREREREREREKKKEEKEKEEEKKKEKKTERVCAPEGAQCDSTCPLKRTGQSI
jgi:hypothetical protein